MVHIHTDRCHAKRTSKAASGASRTANALVEAITMLDHPAGANGKHSATAMERRQHTLIADSQVFVANHTATKVDMSSHSAACNVNITMYHPAGTTYVSMKQRTPKSKLKWLRWRVPAASCCC